ncbi:beta-propeller domain-containing protein [Amycolatopsis arida]|nr:beta-propeller domain-containing protein [Amycolatopsis arida]
MKRDLLRPRWAVLAAAVLVGCVSSGVLPVPFGGAGTAAATPGLVAFDSCDQALAELRKAALSRVGPYGFDRGSVGGFAGNGPAVADGRLSAEGTGEGTGEGTAAAPAAPAREHSGTNTHEAGVGEPDLARTDGRRVVTVVDGRLRVADVASREITSTVEIPGDAPEGLLLHGDRALVLASDMSPMPMPEPLPAPVPRPGPGITGVEPGSDPGGMPEADPGFAPPEGGTRLMLVDLAGPARVLGTLSVAGTFVDARLVDGRARVVVRSAPRLPFSYPNDAGSLGKALRHNESAVAAATIDDWLPRYELTAGSTRREGRLVDCARVSRPAEYSGASLLTVLTVDLAGELGTGDPVSIVADGDTVYATAETLYVANRSGADRTEVHRFDMLVPGPPRYVASGAVDGWLLNQYALSEHAGHLRVATTTDRGERAASASAVTVLARRESELVEVGSVGGLGRGERIHAVRFLGPVGYVVTFRETDPLYTLDLRDPAAPAVVGELKITGYSAYLHDVGNGRLVGVGQEADLDGRRLGLQVSLFDVSDPARPRRVARHHVPGAYSEVESDPHAFLHWPPSGLLVLPTSGPVTGREVAVVGEALVLRQSGASLAEVGTVRHPAGTAVDASVRRALVVGNELWTVSFAGLGVASLGDLTERAWLPFD